MTIEARPGDRVGRAAPEKEPAVQTLRNVYDIDRAPDLALEELTDLLGGKAANLVVMATRLGLPVPPAFAITTATCRAYLSEGWPEGLDEELRAHVARLSEVTGRRFGDPSDPLLVSVRSGAPISMPGMMDTILDLGLNASTAAGLARVTGSPDLAEDCLGRFRQMYRETVGSAPPDDPWRQLRGAVEAVFRSWNSDRARAYRRREGIPDDLGTGVTVQAMVFGNRGPSSGTGVLFTRNPATGDPVLYGDVMFNAQGEDVVAGTHRPETLADLERRLPAVADELRHYAEVLERHYRDLCDIEFTVEEGRLWLLQVRVGKRSPRAALRIAVDMADDPGFPCSREEAVRRTAHHLVSPPRVQVRRPGSSPPLAVGLPASPGVAAGEIATTPEAAEAAADAGRAVILVRTETSPADVRGMARAAGILTSRGGLASHAAVVARGWGIPDVVGAAGVEVGDTEVRIAGRLLRAGERITIDGATGEIHLGDLTGSWSVAPEAQILLDWARELGIDVSGPAQTDAPPPAAADAGRRTPASTDDVLRALLVRGMASADQLATSLGGDGNPVTALLDELGGGGLVETGSGLHRLSADGKLRALDLFARDREGIGGERVAEWSTGFTALDRRMKDTVTAWQMRGSGADAQVNDHTDPDYDARILENLAALHGDVLTWIGPVCDALPRFHGYRARLEQALAAADRGDQRYVASPRVDSYHSVWFELHEDLIRLSGRRRSDQTEVDGT